MNILHNNKSSNQDQNNSSNPGNPAKRWLNAEQNTITPKMLDDKLAERGILEASRKCNWKVAIAWIDRGELGKGYAWCWEIPTNQRAFVLHKFFNPKDTRWSKTEHWREGMAKTTAIYMPQGLAQIRQAIDQAGGILIIASGQADHLSFLSAGYENVISFYGENNIPKDELLSLFQVLGNVRTVEYYPDQDKAGHKSARRLVTILNSADIPVTALELPYPMGSKKDVNDLWIDCKFDAGKFYDVLFNLPLLEISRDLHLHEPIIAPKPELPKAIKNAKIKKGTIDWDAVLRDTKAILARDYRLDSKNSCVCPLHGNTSSKRDAKLNDRSLYCFVCGTHKISDLARYFGIDIDDYRTLTEDGASAVSMSAEHLFQSLKPFTIPFTPTRSINSRFINTVLDANLLDNKLVGIQSPTGTGKTELMIDLIKATNKQNKRAIVIVHRRKLVANIIQRLRRAGIGATHYANASDQELIAPVLVITVDSLPRLIFQAEFDASTYGLVVLDEATQVLQHLSKSSTLDGKERNVQIAWHNITNWQVGTILALDANLDDQTMLMLMFLLGDVFNQQNWGKERPYNILNTYTPMAGTATQFTHLSGMLADMAQRIVKRERIAIYAPTREQGKAIHEFLSQYGTGIYLSAQTIDLERERLALQDLDKAEYQYLIYTPVLGTGYDITREHDAVYLVGIGNHLTAYDWLQGIGRVRNAKQLCYFIPEQQTNVRLDTADAIEARLGAKMLSLQTQHDGTHSIGGYARIYGTNVIDSFAMSTYSLIQAVQNSIRNNAYGHWLEGILRHGWSVPAVNDRSNEEVEKALSAMKEKIKTANITSMLSIAPSEYITDIDYNQVRSTQERTGFQYITDAVFWSNQAWKVFNLTGIPNNPETADYFYTSTNRKRFMNYYIRTRRLASSIDQAEYRQQRLMHKRQFAMGKDALIRQMLGAIWGTDDYAVIVASNQHFTEQDVIERFNKAGLADEDGVTNKLKNDLAVQFGWHAKKHSSDHLDILRYMLSKDGMKLCYRQQMVNGERSYIYWLDADTYQQLERFALARDSYLNPAISTTVEGFKHSLQQPSQQSNVKASNKPSKLDDTLPLILDKGMPPS